MNIPAIVREKEPQVRTAISGLFEQDKNHENEIRRDLATELQAQVEEFVAAVLNEASSVQKLLTDPEGQLQEHLEIGFRFLIAGLCRDIFQDSTFDAEEYKSQVHRIACDLAKVVNATLKRGVPQRPSRYQYA